MDIRNNGILQKCQIEDTNISICLHVQTWLSYDSEFIASISSVSQPTSISGAD